MNSANRCSLPQKGGNAGRMNRLLLIDSNTLFRKALRDILSFKFPFLKIEEAATGKEGKQKIATFHPQLIFMDIQLPGEDGFKLACRIKAEHAEIIMVIFTSFHLEEYRTAALHAGIHHVIPKNLWSGHGILALVETLLSGPTKKHIDSSRETVPAEKGTIKKPQKKKKEDPAK